MSLPPIKEVFDALAIKDGLDFDTGTGDIEEIKRMGVLGVNRANEDFRWTALRNLSKRTVGPRAVYDVVYFSPTMRERRRVVRLASDGHVISVLCVRKAG